MPKEKLFSLIQSLSPVEKKFFHHYARRHIYETDTIYLKLFDAIDGQKSYNETRIRQQLSVKPSEKNFHKVKAYLYSLILKSLVIRKSETSSYSQALELLGSVEILCEKQMFRSALEQLELLKKICEEHEFQELALAAIRWEEAISATSQMMNSGDGIQLADYYAKRKNLLHEIAQTVEYRYLFFEWSMINAPFTPPGPDVQEKLAILFGHPLLQPENFPKHNALRRFYFGLNAMKARLYGDHEKAFELSKSIVHIMESYPRGFYYTEILLIYTYYSIVMDAVNAGKFSEAENYLIKLKRLKPESPQIIYSHFHLGFAGELTVLKAMNRIQESLTVIDNFEKSLHLFKPGVSKIHEYRNYLLVMNWLIHIREFDRAIPFINLMKQEKSSDSRVIPFQYHARLLMLVVHFELQNFELLEYLIRHTEYYFSKHPLKLAYPGLLIRFFKNILKPRIKWEREMVTLLQKLDAIRNDPKENYSLRSFEECGWLQSYRTSMSPAGKR